MVDRELTLTYPAAPRAAPDRARHHAGVRLERGGRDLHRQRALDRCTAQAISSRRPASRRRRPTRVPLRRRVHGRDPHVRRDGRTRRDARGRHERRAAPPRPRVPRAHGRARSLRLRLGHEVARGPGAHDVRSVRRVLDPARLGAAGADQDGVPDRHAARGRERAGGHRGGRRGGVGPASGDRRASRCGSTTDAWVEAELGAEDTADTWRQWVYRWDAAPGPHTLQVRATDGTGSTQTARSAPPAPDGATGYHTIQVRWAERSRCGEPVTTRR